MYMFINALILALLLPAASAERGRDGAACRAELRGLELLTIMELPGGIAVEGPWRVLHRGDMTGDATHFMMLATLDRVIERDELTGGRTVIPFPEPVRLAFEGPSQRELVHRAAQVWCATVQRAQENRIQGHVPSQHTHTKTAAL